MIRSDDEEVGTAYKYGELPPYGPPTPARLIRLFGRDREIFLKGRQCENHALGIGAFVYYRRVVESHKNQILDEVIRVTKKIGAPSEMLAALEAAKAEIQFSKALALVKNAIPQALLVNGHNPLTLLHSALSVGLHDQTSVDCAAGSIARLSLAQRQRSIANAWLSSPTRVGPASSNAMRTRAP